MKTKTLSEIFPPGEFIREELEARGWTQGDLAEILGRPLGRINEIICGKRAITPETAKSLAEALGTSAELWLNLESAYQLSRVKITDSVIAHRAKLYSKAPVKEMVKRRWIEHSNNVDVLERRVCNFFKTKNLDQEPSFWSFATRTSLSKSKPTPSQLAWLFRAKYLANAVHVNNKFTNARLTEGIESLHQILNSVEEIRKVPKILADAGIRFLILESLPNTRIDGATFWMDKDSPVIALSLRYDRIDGFWHTLFHELGHVKERHGLIAQEPIDLNLVGKEAQAFDEKTQIEQSVDLFASEHLIQKAILDYFIRRVKPLYWTSKIVNFAENNHVHPGIVVGQLQFRKEIPYSQNRKLLVGIRGIITQNALTDGWGNSPIEI